MARKMVLGVSSDGFIRLRFRRPVAAKQSENESFDLLGLH